MRVATGGRAQGADEVFVEGGCSDHRAAHVVRVGVVRDEHFAEVEGGGHVGPEGGDGEVAAEGDSLGDVAGRE